MKGAGSVSHQRQFSRSPQPGSAFTQVRPRTVPTPPSQNPTLSSNFSHHGVDSERRVASPTISQSHQSMAQVSRGVSPDPHIRYDADAKSKHDSGSTVPGTQSGTNQPDKDLTQNSESSHKRMRSSAYDSGKDLPYFSPAMVAAVHNMPPHISTSSYSRTRSYSPVMLHNTPHMDFPKHMISNSFLNGSPQYLSQQTTPTIPTTSIHHSPQNLGESRISPQISGRKRSLEDVEEDSRLADRSTPATSEAEISKEDNEDANSTSYSEGKS